MHMQFCCSQSNFGALEFELTDKDMQKLNTLEFQKRLVDGSMVRCCPACVRLRSFTQTLDDEL